MGLDLEAEPNPILEDPQGPIDPTDNIDDSLFDIPDPCQGIPGEQCIP